MKCAILIVPITSVMATSPFQNMFMRTNLNNFVVNSKRRRPTNKEGTLSCSSTKKSRKSNTGFYYGICETLLERESSDKVDNVDNVQILEKVNSRVAYSNPKILEVMSSKLETPANELIQQLQQQLQNQINTERFIESLSQSMQEIRDTLSDFRKDLQDLSNTLKNQEQGQQQQENNQHRMKYEQMADNIEDWANSLLQENENDGWKEILCSKLFRHKFNPNGQTKCYLKFLPDSRKKQESTTELYPCIKILSTIHAPYEDVCEYLSKPNHVQDYNDLVIHHEDVEVVAPYAKICWASCPQVLFLKPRDFVTFCSLRWRKAGDMQVVVNESIDHEDHPGEDESGKFCRAFALRGANFISRHPEFHDKTLFTLISHANPGGNVPFWSIKTAANTLAQIEPFKMCHKIESSVKKYMSSTERERQISMVSSSGASLANRPGGLSQMGYACFWPQGGGLFEGGGSKHTEDNLERIENDESFSTDEESFQ